MKTTLLCSLTCAVAASLLAACGTTPNVGSAEQRNDLHTNSVNSLAEFKASDPAIQEKLNGAYAYAIFPKVLSAGAGLGGGHGNGEVYDREGRFIGYADVSQGNIGIQLGAQKFAELVLFENESTLRDFQNSTVEFDARGSAVAADKGTAGAADYDHGVMIFAEPESGLMIQAAVGGQKFRYIPVPE